MTELREAAALTGGIALLERAINYALGCLHAVPPDALHLPTPCAGWDLRALLAHVDDSLAALHEAVDLGRVEPPVAAVAGDPMATDPGDLVAGDLRAGDLVAGDLRAGDLVAGDPVAGGLVAGDLVARVRERASRLLGAWAGVSDAGPVAVAGYSLTTTIVTSVGAVEVAVHGWDIAAACGRRRPVPPLLAGEMLQLVPLFVTGEDRPVRFAAPVAVPPGTGPGDRLVAFLGRDPS